MSGETAPLERTLRMTCEYEGTRYVGWQYQNNGLAVQQVVEAALSRAAGHPIRVMAAGRTDAGVHSRGQVISFRTSSTIPPRGLLRSAMLHLPADVALKEAADVPAGFCARRSAVLRWYRYFVRVSFERPGWGCHHIAWLRGRPEAVNYETLCRAAQALAGNHNFSAFRASACRARRTQLDMEPPVITRLSPPDDAAELLLAIDYRCRSFLQNQVRIMTGTLLQIARGELPAYTIEEMLATGRRAEKAITLAPEGLVLWRVYYPPDFEPSPLEQP